MFERSGSGRWRLLAAVVGLAVVASGCAQSTSGSPVSPSAPLTSAVPSAFPSTSTTSSVPATPSFSLPPTTLPPTTTSPSTTPPTSGSPGQGANCAPSAGYCDDFADPQSGWPTANKAVYHAYYTTGDTFRMGETDDSTVTSLAPKSLAFTHNYSVQTDVDVIVKTQAAGTDWGMRCWSHYAKAAGKRAGFDLLVGRTAAGIVLRDDTHGSEFLITRKTFKHSLLKSGRGVNHLSGRCLQAAGPGGGLQARFTITLNGKRLISTTYPTASSKHPWRATSGIALETSGKGIDVLYDNFTLRSLCTSGRNKSQC